jgi:hypothetical protein
MEIHHPAVQFDTQFVSIDDKLDDKLEVALVRYRSTALRLWHISRPLKSVMSHFVTTRCADVDSSRSGRGRIWDFWFQAW